MIGSGANLVSDWLRILVLSQSARRILLASPIGVGVSTCPKVARIDGREEKLEVFAVARFEFPSYKGGPEIKHQGSPALTTLLCVWLSAV